MSTQHFNSDPDGSHHVQLSLAPPVVTERSPSALRSHSLSTLKADKERLPPTILRRTRSDRSDVKNWPPLQQHLLNQQTSGVITVNVSAAEEDDFFQSATVLNQMSDFCKTCMPFEDRRSKWLADDLV